MGIEDMVTLFVIKFYIVHSIEPGRVMIDDGSPSEGVIVLMPTSKSASLKLSHIWPSRRPGPGMLLRAGTLAPSILPVHSV